MIARVVLLHTTNIWHGPICICKRPERIHENIRLPRAILPVKPKIEYAVEVRLRLPEVKTKILIVHGERDSLIPVINAERLQTLNPRAQLLRVPGAGHGDVLTFEAYNEELMTQLTAL